MVISKSGYEFDKALYQKAHYHYMMAADFARDNGRVAATVWQNLGWLHKTVGQYALAVDYFERRDKFPFISLTSELAFRWVFANTYYYNDQSVKAVDQLTQLKGRLSKEDELAVQEKIAFYAMQAKLYSVAISTYEGIFSTADELSTLNEAKMRLAYAYSLSKVGRKSNAVDQYRKVLTLSSELSHLSADEFRQISFNPSRLTLLANGFLAELVNNSSSRVGYLRSRIDQLIKLKDSTDVAFDEASRLTFLAKDYQKLALAHESMGNKNELLNAAIGSIKTADEWRNTAGDNIGPVVYRVVVNYLSLAISNPELFLQTNDKVLLKMIAEMDLAFSEYPYPTITVIYQHVKLKILFAAYEKMVKGNSTVDFEPFLSDQRLDVLKMTSKDKYQELQALTVYFSK